MRPILERAARAIAGLYLCGLGVTVCLVYPVLWLVGFVYVGVWAAGALDAGPIGGIAVAIGALAAMGFLSAFVWHPHVWPMTARVLDVLRDL